MPEERRRDADERAFWALGLPTLNHLARERMSLKLGAAHAIYIIQYLERSVVYYDLMKTSLDEPTSDMLELLSGLHEQVSTRCRELDGDTFARITSPDVEPRIA